VTLPNEGAWEKYAPPWATRAAEREQAIIEWERGAEEQRRQIVPGRALKLTGLEDVEIRPVEWLWHKWLAASQLHMLIGKSGWGKSTFASWLVGRLTSGAPWPDEPDLWREPIRCAILSLEETDHGRLKARLLEAGAVPSQVDILSTMIVVDDEGRVAEQMWQLPGDCPALADQIIANDYGLVVIDGLGYAVGGDSHNYANVGSALISLAGVAGQTGAAILGIAHPPKGASSADTAAIGSYAWTTVPRVSWLLGKDPTDNREDDEPDVRRSLQVSTTNYKYPTNGWSFQIAETDLEVPVVADLRPSMVPADDILRPSEGSRDVVDWLRDLLGQGPKTADLVKSAAESVEIGWRTVEKYKRAAQAGSRKTAGGWEWYLKP
jgi:RecA-family ATPase